MRELIKGADIAIANFENPAPNRVRWHTSGTVFSADPGIIDGLVNAGIDYVSLANNHIGDAGDAGILQTIDNLEERGLAYSGAGKDSAAARKPAILEAGGMKVAVLGYDAIASYYSAGEDDAGSSRLTLSRARNDIKRARKGRRRHRHRLPALGHGVPPRRRSPASRSSPATSSTPAPT